MNDQLTLPRLDSNRSIEQLAAIIIEKQGCEMGIELPLRHHFLPGIYIREILMPVSPGGTVVIGHLHKTQHFNLVLKGKARILIDGKVTLIQAPAVFVSNPGVRKVLNILEDMVWCTVHLTNETDIAKLEDELVDKTNHFLDQLEPQGYEEFMRLISTKDLP